MQSFNTYTIQYTIISYNIISYNIIPGLATRGPAPGIASAGACKATPLLVARRAHSSSPGVAPVRVRPASNRLPNPES